MLRLSILQSVNGAVLRLNINENRFLTTCMNNLNTRNGTVKTKDTSKLQDTADSDIDGNAYNQIKNKRAVLKKQKRDSMLSKKKKNKLVSIFGFKTVKNYEIRYIKDNKDLKIPYVTHVLSETMSPKVKTALERWKKNKIDIYGEEYFKTYCKDLSKSGNLLNSYIQMMFLRKIVDIPSSIKPIHSSIKSILDDLHIFHRTEINMELIHPILRYRSIINLIASYRYNRDCLYRYKEI